MITPALLILGSGSLVATALQRFHLDSDVDEIIISAEVGTIKPEPAIYQLATHRLGVKPQNALFIDDESRFTAAAQQVGMQAIQFKNTQQAIIDICHILGS